MVHRNTSAWLRDLWITWSRVWFNFRSPKRYFFFQSKKGMIKWMDPSGLSARNFSEWAPFLCMFFLFLSEHELMWNFVCWIRFTMTEDSSLALGQELCLMISLLLTLMLIEEAVVLGVCNCLSFESWILCISSTEWFSCFFMFVNSYLLQSSNQGRLWSYHRLDDKMLIWFLPAYFGCRIWSYYMLDDKLLMWFLTCLFWLLIFYLFFYFLFWVSLVQWWTVIYFQLQVICHLVRLMVPINQACILQDSLCLVCPFHHSRVVLLLSHMPFRVVELFMDRLELFTMSLRQEVGVLELGVAVLVLRLAVIFSTNKILSNLLELSGLLLTSLHSKIQIANHLSVAH